MAIDPLHGLFLWVLTTSAKSTVLISLFLALRHFFAQSLALKIRQPIWGALLFSLLVPIGWSFNASELMNLRLLPLQADNSQSLSQSLSQSVAFASAQSLQLQQSLLPQHIAVKSDQAGEIKGASDDSNAPILTDYIVNFFASIPWLTLFGATWMLGVALLLVLTVKNIRFHQRLKRLADPVAGNTLSIFECCCQQIFSANSIPLLASNYVDSPMVIGWRKPVVILPKKLYHAFTDENLRHIFLHELSHIKRSDIGFFWFATAALFVHWFNPIIWLAIRAFRADVELACDRDVLRLLPLEQRKPYGKTLLDVADSGQTPLPAIGVVCIVENRSELAARIDRIANIYKSSVWVSVPAGFLLAAALASAATQPLFIRGKAHNVDFDGGLNATPLFSQIKQRLEENHGAKIIISSDDKPKLESIYNQLTSANYAQFLDLLARLELSAYQLDENIYILPVERMRYEPVPTYQTGLNYPDAQYVTAVITSHKNLAKVFRELRILVPRHALLSTVGDQLLITTTFKNLKEVQAVLLEKGYID